MLANVSAWLRDARRRANKMVPLCVDAVSSPSWAAQSMFPKPCCYCFPFVIHPTLLLPCHCGNAGGESRAHTAECGGHRLEKTENEKAKDKNKSGRERKNPNCGTSSLDAVMPHHATLVPFNADETVLFVNSLGARPRGWPNRTQLGNKRGL